jgi:aarF domain-containing kinase
VYDLCITNGGLYIKLGQGLALQSAVLPPSFNRVFSVLYDSAPVVPFSVVEAIIEQDLGKPIHELFASFDPEPVASASIAQVHKARLLDGREVAVKVQKPDILPQLDWDLYSYRIVLSLFEYVFELPVTWTCDYTEKHLRQETDFLHEASNAEQARLDLTPFNTSVYIPAVDWSRTSKRVMTSEWMDGVRITERDTIEGEYGFSMEQVVAQAVDLFAFQIFESGFVHCMPLTVY